MFAQQRAIAVNGTDNIESTIFLNNLTLLFDEVTQKQNKSRSVWLDLN